MSYLKNLRAGTFEQEALAHTWRSVRKTLLAAGTRRWSVVTGPVGALQATLMDLQWDPSRPCVWKDHEGSMWVIDDSLGLQDTFRVIKQEVVNDLWRRTAISSHLGNGLQLIPAIRQVKGMYHKLCKDNPRNAMMYLRIICGAWWEESRLHAAGLTDSDLCYRCQRQVGNMHHHLYVCPASETMAIHDHAATFRARGRAAEGQPPAFYQRLVLPTSAIEVPSPWGVGQVFEVGTAPSFEDLASLHLALDGSGGAHSAAPELRRCGWAFVFATMQSGALVYARYGNLPGDVQTVPRSEIYATLQAYMFIASIAHGREGG